MCANTSPVTPNRGLPGAEIGPYAIFQPLPEGTTNSSPRTYWPPTVRNYSNTEKAHSVHPELEETQAKHKSCSLGRFLCQEHCPARPPAKHCWGGLAGQGFCSMLNHQGTNRPLGPSRNSVPARAPQGYEPARGTANSERTSKVIPATPEQVGTIRSYASTILQG